MVFRQKEWDQKKKRFFTETCERVVEKPLRETKNKMRLLLEELVLDSLQIKLDK